MPASRILLPLVLVVVLAACTGEDEPQLGTAEIREAEVVQTVAAPAELAPAARAAVTTSVSGEVVELAVDDGDRVQAGDLLVRLSSDELEQQIEQAEEAVAAARAAGEGAAGAGLDLAPVVGSLRGQVDTVLPGLIGALDAQVAAAESALGSAVLGLTEVTDAADDLRGEVLDALEDGDVLEVADGIDPDDLPQGPDGSAAIEQLEDAQREVHEARGQLAATQASFREASGELEEVEAQLAAQTEATEAAQSAAVEAQVEQAQAALDATEARLDELTVQAPIDGVVQLERDRGGPGPPAGGGLDGLDGLGDLGGLADDVPDLGELGSSDGAAGSGDDRPLTVGSQLGAGQVLATVYDLSSFTAQVQVDELDIVEVATGQPVEVLVDAFAGQELRGRIERVAIEPVRDPAGGARYPVTVALTDVPEDVELRVGLTAAVEIEVARIDADLAVPTSALLRRSDREVVYVVRDGIAEEVPVELLAIGDQDAAIDGEVERGETVITTGVELVADGDEVDLSETADTDSDTGDDADDEAAARWPAGSWTHGGVSR